MISICEAFSASKNNVFRLENGRVTVEYLAQYGLGAYLGRFRSNVPIEFVRGDRVVLDTARGQDLGIILDHSKDRFAKLVEPVSSGEIVRRASNEDERLLQSRLTQARNLLEEAQQLVDQFQLPLVLLDAEIPLDGQMAIFQTIPSSEIDLQPLAEQLAQRSGLQIQLLDLTKSSKEPEQGCGKEGCGSTGGGCSSCGTESKGGCSTGSCSKGSVKSASELTAYFANLRAQMEANKDRIPLS
jgi:hypothetical protein